MKIKEIISYTVFREFRNLNFLFPSGVRARSEAPKIESAGPLHFYILTSKPGPPEFPQPQKHFTAAQEH